jgi:hypothetical protein
MLGKHDLNNFNEKNSKTSSISEIILHPDWQWNSHIDESYNGDIAIVLLREIVKFTELIRPVCLPHKSFVEVTGKGWIAGWGKTETSKFHASLPNEVEISAINGYRCLITSPKLVHAASESSFCGGYKNESKGHCLGDSGGGFYFYDSRKDLWEIKGIISASIKDQSGNCETNEYQLYTNVPRYADWIKKRINYSQPFIDDTFLSNLNDINLDSNPKTEIPIWLITISIISIHYNIFLTVVFILSRRKKKSIF